MWPAWTCNTAEETHGKHLQKVAEVVVVPHARRRLLAACGLMADMLIGKEHSAQQQLNAITISCMNLVHASTAAVYSGSPESATVSSETAAPMTHLLPPGWRFPCPRSGKWAPQPGAGRRSSAAAPDICEVAQTASTCTVLCCSLLLWCEIHHGFYRIINHAPLRGHLQQLLVPERQHETRCTIHSKSTSRVNPRSPAPLGTLIGARTSSRECFSNQHIRVFHGNQLCSAT